MPSSRFARYSLSFLVSLAVHHSLDSRIAGAQDAQDAQFEVRRAHCLGRAYDYQLFSSGSHKPRPTVLLLHGAGGSSGDVIDPWAPLARRENIVLIAPEIPRDSAFEAIAPQVAQCVVEDAKHAATLDPQRIYVFGWSMGGYLTFDIAMFASTYFAGAIVYASAIGNDYFYILDRPERKIPIALYIGDRDRPSTLAQARRTRDSLVNRGFPVHYVEFPDQNHQFDPIADRLSTDAWNYLSSFRPPAQAP